jgi:hypothetical protein
MSADRTEPPLAATEYVSVPVPVPVLPDGNVIHDAGVVAVQSQPVEGVVVIVTLNVPPAAGTDCVVGLSEYEQPVPSWLMLNIWLPIVIVPLRGAPVLLPTV